MGNYSGLGQALNQENIEADRIKSDLPFGLETDSLTSFLLRRRVDVHLPRVHGVAIHDMVMRYGKSLWSGAREDRSGRDQARLTLWVGLTRKLLHFCGFM